MSTEMRFKTERVRRPNWARWHGRPRLEMGRIQNSPLELREAQVYSKSLMGSTILVQKTIGPIRKPTTIQCNFKNAPTGDGLKQGDPFQNSPSLAPHTHTHSTATMEASTDLASVTHLRLWIEMIPNQSVWN